MKRRASIAIALTAGVIIVAAQEWEGSEVTKPSLTVPVEPAQSDAVSLVTVETPAMYASGPPESPVISKDRLLLSVPDDEALYRALYSADPRERRAALDAIAAHPERFTLADRFMARIEDMATDFDAEVAEQAMHAQLQLLAWHVIEEDKALPQSALWTYSHMGATEPVSIGVAIDVSVVAVEPAEEDGGHARIETAPYVMGTDAMGDEPPPL